MTTVPVSGPRSGSLHHAAAPPLIFVTNANIDLEITLAIVRAAARALGPRRLLVQLRDKENGPVVIRTAALALRAVTREVEALFVVNGATSIAHEVLADGVHMPWDRGGALVARVAAARRMLGEHILVTAAVHDDDEVRAALEAGVTGLLVSPIFATPGKGPPRGVATLTSARSLVAVAPGFPPTVYALGGVTTENVASCAQAGADGAAVIGALYDAGPLGCAAVALTLAGAFGAAGSRGS